MNRPPGLTASGDFIAPLVAIGTMGIFAVLMAAIMFVRLPIWTLLIPVAAVVYGFAVLHRPMIGIYVVVAVFFVPVRFSIGISLLQAVGTATAALLLLWFLYHRHKIVFGSFLLPMFLIGPLILVSMWYTHDAGRTMQLFLRWIFNMMFIMLLLNLVTRFDLFKKVLWSIILMASVNSVAAIHEYATSTEYLHRSTGFVANPNSLGGLATLAFPLALYQYLYGKTRMRFVGLFLSGILVAGIVSSVSRGALVSLLVVFVVICFRERRRVLPLALIAALAFALTPVLPEFFIERVGNLGEDVKKSVAFGGGNDLTHRGHLNTAGLRIWAAHPILGVGIGNFKFYYHQPEFLSGWAASEDVVAHNIYIQALAEMGTVGGLLLLWLLFNSGKSLWRTRQATFGTERRRVYARAIEMMTLAILINTASTGSLMGNDIWMFLGLTMIAGRVAEKDAEAPQDGNRGRSHLLSPES